MHFYGLLYADCVGGDDPERASRFRERACAFATEYGHWFDSAGRAPRHSSTRNQTPISCTDG